VITLPIPLLLIGHPRLLRSVVAAARLVGVRLVSSGSGLLLSKDPEELAIYEVCHAADARGLEALSSEQRTAVLAWSAKGVIDNGGFRFYFEGDWKIREVSAAFRDLDISDVADACEEASQVFPANLPPQDWTRRNSILAGVAPDALRSLDERVWALDWSRLRAAIVAYMDNHEEQFRRFRVAAQPRVAADGAKPRC
jgi:hypothetical protein